MARDLGTAGIGDRNPSLCQIVSVAHGEINSIRAGPPNGATRTLSWSFAPQCDPSSPLLTLHSPKPFPKLSSGFTATAWQSSDFSLG